MKRSSETMNPAAMISCLLLMLGSAAERASGANVADLQFSPDGRQVMVTTVRVVGTPTRTQTTLFDVRRRTWGKRLASSPALLSPDGSYFLTASKPMRAYTLGGNLLCSFESYGGIRPLAVSPSGRFVVARGDEYIGVWEARTGRLLSRGTYYPNDFIEPLIFSPDSRFLYAATRSGPALYTLGVPRYFRFLKRYPVSAEQGGSGFDIHFGRKLLCASIIKREGEFLSSARILLMTLNGRRLKQATLKHLTSDGTIQVHFSHDGRRVAVMTATTLTIFSSSTLKVVRRYTSRKFGLEGFAAIASSPTENLLAIGGYNNSKPFFVRFFQ